MTLALVRPPEPTDTPDAPPAHIPTPRGLPPQRAALARWQTFRAQVAAEVASLEGGREKLEAQIARADEAKDTCRTEAEAGAAGIIDAIKKGASWALNLAVSSAHSHAAQALATSGPALDVARAALARIEAEINEKQAQLSAIDRRIEAASIAALREHAAADLGKRYAETLASLREMLVQLEALERLSGQGHDGRLVAELPGFRLAGHRHPVVTIAAPMPDVAGAIAAWRALANAWRDDPCAKPEKHLRFKPASADDPTPYEQRTAAERNIIDRERAGYFR